MVLRFVSVVFSECKLLAFGGKGGGGGEVRLARLHPGVPLTDIKYVSSDVKHSPLN